MSAQDEAGESAKRAAEAGPEADQHDDQGGAPKKKSKFSDSAPEPVAIVGPAPGPPGAPVPPPAPVTAPVLMTTPNAAYEVPPAYAPVAPGLSPDFSTMPVSIQNQFFHIFNGGMCTAADLDGSIYKSLNDFTEDTAHEIVAGFARAELGHVRNKTGFFIGILKQFRKQGRGLKRDSTVAQPGSALAMSQQQAYGGGAYGGAPYYDPYAYGLPPSADGSAPPDPYSTTSSTHAAALPPPGTYDPYGTQASVGAHAPSTLAHPHIPPPPPPPPNHHQQQQPVGYGAYGAYDTSAYGYPPPAPPSAALSASGLPASVQQLFDHAFRMGLAMPSDVPQSIYDSLKDFDETTQYAIVERFTKSDLSRVRNKTGYIIGILKQARQGKLTGHGFGSLGGAGAPPQAPEYASYTTSTGYTKLSLYCQQKIRELCDNGQMRDGDLDHSVFDSLASFSEEDQLAMVDSFCSKDLGSIRNKTAFFIGILKRQRSIKASENVLGSTWM